MAIPFTCPHCGTQTNVDDRFAGQSGPCSHCGKAITIPYTPGAMSMADGAAARRSGMNGFVIAIVVAAGFFGLLFIVGILVALLLPALQVARYAARQAQSQNNLKQIALGMLNYEAKYGTLPPAYTVDENGRPMHSWRVLILPYVEQNGLYSAYRMDEPWDGPNNSQLHAVIPPCYVDPSSISDGMGYTSYVVITGENTLFPGAESVSLGEVTDGASRTLLAVPTSESDIVWCEPRDLEFDSMSYKIGDIGGISSDGSGPVPVVFLDGSTRKLHPELSEAEVQSMIQRNNE
jgi:hypothetical protein